MKINKFLQPLILALVFVLGLWLGGKFLRHSQSVQPSNVTIQNTNAVQYNSQDIEQNYELNQKYPDFFNLLQNFYVDSLNLDSLAETVFPAIIGDLDPHSIYISAKDLDRVNESLDGEFVGVGVQFSILNDTVQIVTVLDDSPALRAGLLAGDKIVMVNDTLFVGDSITNELVFTRFRGLRHTHILLKVSRRSSDELLTFDVERDKVNVKSVEASYMVTDKIGLIGFKDFGANTANEFQTALFGLKEKGCQQLIVDLRGNSGGYMSACVNMLELFLPKNSLLVYVKGRAFPYHEDRVRITPPFGDMDIVVLIDEFSASASEIFSGAIQDNDRGLVIGRRSYGKGLVQQQFPLQDGSAVRLTVAHYYTPSGRCIQRPYTLGDSEAYHENFYDRFSHGEQYSKDSIHQDSLAYHTLSGRLVYGGGGIMPDIFVPNDSTGASVYFTKIVNKNLPYLFAYEFADRHREELAQYTTGLGLDSALEHYSLMKKFRAYAKEHGVEASHNDWKKSQDWVKRQVNCYIVRDLLGSDGFYPVWNKDDITIHRAVSELEKGIDLK